MAEKSEGKLTKSERLFIDEIRSYTPIAKDIFGGEHDPTPATILGILDRVPTPEEDDGAETETLIYEMKTARVIAVEAFGASGDNPDTIFDVFDRLFGEPDDDE